MITDIDLAKRGPEVGMEVQVVGEITTGTIIEVSEEIKFLEIPLPGEDKFNQHTRQYTQQMIYTSRPDWIIVKYSDKEVKYVLKDTNYHQATINVEGEVLNTARKDSPHIFLTGNFS